MSNPHARPPLLGRALLRLRRLRNRRREVEDDLFQLFERRARQHGRRHASWRYCVDALSLWRWSNRDVRNTVSLDWPGAHGLMEDVRFALRMFSRQPAGVAITVAGLALAIGLGTAIFSLLNAAALRGTGITDPASIYRLHVHHLDPPRLTGSTSRMIGNWSAQDYAWLERAATSVSTAAALSFMDRASFRPPDGSDRTESISVMPVSGRYFPVLGGRALVGRMLTPQDDEPGAPRVVCLSHPFWTTRMAGDPAIVGATIWLDDVPFTIVGVAERGFHGLDSPPPAVWLTFGVDAELWRSRQTGWAGAARAEITLLKRLPRLTPVQRTRLEALESELMTAPDRWNPPLEVVARLRPGSSPGQTAAEATAIARALAEERAQPRERVPDIALAPVTSDRSSPELRVAVGAAMTVIAVLLFLACSNIANLLLANAAGRRREIGTRLALGATGGRIVRQLITESLLLGLAGGGAGLALAMWLTPVLARLLHAPALLDVAPDVRVYAFAAGATVLAGLLAGLAPARYGRRGDLLGALQADRAGAPGSLAPNRLRTILVGAQATGSILLLIVAALFTRSLVQAMSFDLGFDPDRLVSVSVPFSRGYDAPRTMTYWNAAIDSIRQLPDVSGASLSAIPPFGAAYAPQPIPHASERRYVLRNEVSAEYFETVGIRLLRGRTFTPEEVRSEAPVAVISAHLARRFWPDDEPLGSTLDRVWGPPDPADSVPRGLLRKPAGTQIIGVVAETITRFGSHDAPTIYLPLSSSTSRAAHLVVSTHGSAEAVTRRIEEALLGLDPNLRPAARRVREAVDRELELPAAVAASAGLLSVTAVGLAAIGLFGVTTFVVNQRRHEVSVRMALGATGTAIVRMLLRDSLRPVMVGMVCGLGLAMLVGQVISRVLYGVSGHDPIAIFTAVIVLAATAVAAVLFPATQAARVSPAEMLKHS